MKGCWRSKHPNHTHISVIWIDIRTFRVYPHSLNNSASNWYLLTWPGSLGVSGKTTRALQPHRFWPEPKVLCLAKRSCPVHASKPQSLIPHVSAGTSPPSGRSRCVRRRPPPRPLPGESARLPRPRWAAAAARGGFVPPATSTVAAGGEVGRP